MKEQDSLPLKLYTAFFGRAGRHSLFIVCIEAICTVLFITMALVLFAQTASRFCGVSIFWAEELARYTMVWLVFLGSTVAVYHGAHTRIGALVNLLPPVRRRYVEAAVSLLCALIIGIIAYYGTMAYKIGMMGRSPAMGIRLGYIFGSVTFCGSLMVLFFVNRAVRQLLNKTLPEDEAPVAPEEEL